METELEQLNQERERLQAELEDVERRLEENEKKIADVFWASHPGVRLNYGDSLLVTPETENMVTVDINYLFSRYFRSGDTACVDSTIPDNRDGVFWLDISTTHSDENFSVSLPVEIIQKMREAYLAQRASYTAGLPKLPTERFTVSKTTTYAVPPELQYGDTITIIAGTWEVTFSNGTVHILKVDDVPETP